MIEKDVWLPSEQNITDYQLLIKMLQALKSEFDILSSKKADVELNKVKIKMTNRVLEPLKELLKNESSYKFLDLLDEVDLPTNSDVVLIISQYIKAIDEFKDTYYIRDEYQSTYLNKVYRWMTKEYPPNYYKGKKKKDY